MEIQLNKDLSKVQENVFMGLNPRQALWTGIGVGLGVGVFWLCKSQGVSVDICSYICMAVVVPAAAMGFVTYHGLPFERLVILWIRNFFFVPRHLAYRLENPDYERDKGRIAEAEKKEAAIRE